MPRLEKWLLIEEHLYGNIYDDNRFLVGSPVRTSKVKEINEAEHTAQTKNTLYVLGEKLVIE